MSVSRSDIPAQEKTDGVLCCERCGTPLPAREAGKAGRPFTFCPPKPPAAPEPGEEQQPGEKRSACWRAQHHLLELTTAIDEIQDRLSPEEWLKLRGEVWALVNSRPWNKGVKRRATASAA